MRWKTWSIVVERSTCALVLLGLLLWTAKSPSAEPGGIAGTDLPGAKAPASRQNHRSREGSLLTEERGSFELAGERVLFIPAGSKDSYRVLENLALERVLREMEDAREQKTWAVSGQLTEFKGANYLLVTKSLLQLPGPPGVLPQALPAAAGAQSESSGQVANRAGLR
jgi:hypothetical protein